MNIAIGADHGGFELKEKIVEYLKSRKYKVKDFGTSSDKPCDYPPIGYEVAKAVSERECDKGILICKTGIGLAIVANKIRGVRAAVCHTEELAKSSREHNDCNILVFGAKYIGFEEVKKILEVWLESDISEERHRKRVDQIREIENKEFK